MIRATAVQPGDSGQPSEHTVLLITNHFPYGTGESFIENEINYLANRFKKVIVVSRTKESSVRSIYVNFISEKINPRSNITEKLLLLFLYIFKAKRVLSLMRAEKKLIRQTRKKISRNIRRVLRHDLSKGLVTANRIEKILKKNGVSGSVILYSYWMNTGALAVSLVKNNKLQLTKISRGHGSDIYEYLHNSSYLSFRTVLCTKLDGVFPISEFGKKQLSRFLHPSESDRITVSRLGTPLIPIVPAKQKQEKSFVLVSCSNIIPLKRLHFIIESLENVEHPIHWIHFGDGPDRKKIEELAGVKLGKKDNIQYSFMGHVANETVREFYRLNYIDLFINTSSTEGIPVSIMEALSCGIPVIACNVGAVSEIVSDQHGRLLPDTAGPTEIAQAISSIFILPEQDRQELRLEAFNFWQQNYSAEKNYQAFIGRLITLAKKKG